MYFEILPSPYPRGKKFIVRQIGNNHKVLNTSEVLNSHRSAMKNIFAVVRMFGTQKCTTYLSAFDYTRMLKISVGSDGKSFIIYDSLPQRMKPIGK